MFEKNIILAPYSNYKIGGPAQFFVKARTPEEVIRASEEAKKLGIPIFVLGGGTNILIKDEGLAGLVLKAEFATLEKNEELIRVGAGVAVKDLLDFTVTHELSGLEWAGGLPGSVGGAIWGNAGAFGGEIKDSVSEVVSVDISSPTPKLLVRTAAECHFSYRTSIFKERTQAGKGEVIVEAVLKLRKGNREQIQAGIEEKIRYRKERQPLEYPNIGSIFKNIDITNVPAEVLKSYQHKIKTDPFPVLPTAVLIDAAGLKGTVRGGARVSEKHPNFIVNFNQASDKDVRALADIVAQELKEKFGVDVEREVIFL